MSRKLAKVSKRLRWLCRFFPEKSNFASLRVLASFARTGGCVSSAMRMRGQIAFKLSKNYLAPGYVSGRR